MNETNLYLQPDQLAEAYAESPAHYITALTDAYLRRAGGTLSADAMPLFTPDQHALLCYRILLDEVGEGGFIQLVQNGFGPYVLDGPFPSAMKKDWGLREFGKFIYEVRHEYHKHREALEADMDDAEFMALYEQFEDLNELGDSFLDDFEEDTTPRIAAHVRQYENLFNTKAEP